MLRMGQRPNDPLRPEWRAIFPVTQHKTLNPQRLHRLLNAVAANQIFSAALFHGANEMRGWGDVQGAEQGFRKLAGVEMHIK